MEYEFLLRDLAEDDATEEYLSWFEDQEVKRNITWQPDSNLAVAKSQLVAYINKSIACPTSRLIGIFHNSLHIGNIGFSRINLYPRHALVGILIGNKKYRGMGIASECLMHSCMLFSRLYKVSCFELRAFKWNQRAIKAYQKAGFICISSGRLVNQHKDGQVMSLDMKNLIKRELQNSSLKEGEPMIAKFNTVKTKYTKD